MQNLKGNLRKVRVRLGILYKVVVFFEEEVVDTAKLCLSSEFKHLFEWMTAEVLKVPEGVQKEEKEILESQFEYLHSCEDMVLFEMANYL